MIKKNQYEIASSQIAEVDNRLEEDSQHFPDQLQLVASSSFTHAKKQAQAISQASKTNQFQQPLNFSSLLLKQGEGSRFPAVLGLNNQSALTIKNSAISSTFQQDLKKYFNVCIRNIEAFPEFQKRLASEMTNKIKGQIKKGSLQISQATRNLEFQHSSKQKDELSLKRELVRKKEEAIQTIKEIEEERLSLIISSRKKAHRSRVDKNDVLSEQQKHKLAQLVSQKKQFQRKLAEKTEQLVKEAKQRKLQDQKERQQFFIAENQKKKIRILKSLKQLQINSQERQQTLKKSVLRQRRSYTHKRYEKQWEQQLRLEEQQERQLLQLIHRKSKFSIEQIKEHYKKHSLELKRRESTTINKQPKVTQSLPRRAKTIFDRIIEQQLQVAKSMNQRKNAKTKEREIKKKIAEYQQIVDQKHKPRGQYSNFFVVPARRNYSSIQLSKVQRYQKGLQYLAIAKELKKDKQNFKKAEQPKAVTEYNLYKDYLKERQRVNFNVLKKQFSQIIKRPKQNYQQMQNAKVLAEEIQAKCKKNPDSKLYQSMKNKLLLLDSLYQ